RLTSRVSRTHCLWKMMPRRLASHLCRLLLGKSMARIHLWLISDAFEIHVDQHPATATKEERQRSINRYLADMLKVLKE
ncbi:hypothetical protein MTO96_051161, partial [Rhipicephalus appendiculatus]